MAFTSQNRVGNWNQNRGTHHNLGMRNGRLIPKGEVGIRDGQRAVPCRLRPIKGSPRVLVLVLVLVPCPCRAMPTIHFVPCRAHTCSCSCLLMPCPHVPCRGPCRAMPRKNSSLSFFYFFKSACQVIVLFFSILCTFFRSMCFI